MTGAHEGTRPAERHPKGWGEELWIANSPAYCGKKMVLRKGKKCSIHYHKLKDETFYVQSGAVNLEVWPSGYPGEALSHNLRPGDSFHIPPLLSHRFTGLEDSEIFEFSTQHFEEDSYRLLKGD